MSEDLSVPLRLYPAEEQGDRTWLPAVLSVYRRRSWLGGEDVIHMTRDGWEPAKRGQRFPTPRVHEFDLTPAEAEMLIVALGDVVKQAGGLS